MNRRPFMKLAVGATVGSMFAKAQEPGGEAKKLGWALVGLGSLSKNQIAPALQKTKLAKLSAVVTGTPAKGVEWREKYGLAEDKVYDYGNIDRIIDDKDIDVVYIVLPNSMHHEFTIRAAKAGKHVYCEKPMANSAKECREMIAACEKADVKLGVAYRCRFEAHHKEAIRFSREKVFGALKHIDAGFGFKIGDPAQWRLRKDLAGGGALMDVGVYALNACRYLTGEEPVEISALETKTDPEKFAEVDETIIWQMKFASGATANCVTTYQFNGMNHFTVYAEKGRFGMGPAYGYSGQKGWTADPKVPFEFPPSDHFELQMDAFSESILRNQPFAVPGEDGLKDLLAVEAIYRSIQSGKAEKVESV